MGEASCTVFGEPWYPQALQLQPADYQQTKIRVSDLIVQDEGNRNYWDIDKMTNLLGYGHTMQIISTVQPPTGQGPDRLIFKLSVNGSFSVAKACEAIRNRDQPPNLSSGPMWKHIWKAGNVAPRVRLFLWKLLNNALPLGKTLASRGIRLDPTCANCNSGEEDSEHLLFACPFARLCWAISPLTIRSGGIEGDLKEIIVHFIAILSIDQWECFVNTAWAIWRCRNEMVYEAKRPTPGRFLKISGDISNETMLAASARPKKVITQLSPIKSITFPFNCASDGSWKEGGIGGAGYAIFEGEGLVQYGSVRTASCCAIQSEAKALKRAIEIIQEGGYFPCIIYTDNLTLANVVMQLQPPTEMDWRAFTDTMHIWTSLKQNPMIQCEYRNRNLNSLADYLAKKGRIEGWDVTGHTYPIFLS